MPVGPLRLTPWLALLVELTVAKAELNAVALALMAGLAAGYLPWRLFIVQQKIDIGADHVQGFYPHQMVQGFFSLLAGLAEPFDFGFLWPALALALVLAGKRLWRSPMLFLALFVGGNLLAIILAYAVAPTSAAEFPAYVRATLDRLLLHLTPVAALLLALGLRDLDHAPAGAPGEDTMV